jgi:hypothetical protein
MSYQNKKKDTGKCKTIQMKAEEEKTLAIETFRK